MDDLINRQYAIETLLAEGLITAAVYIERMPSADLSEYSDKLWKAAYERGKAEAHPKKGKWLVQFNGWGDVYYECSCCKAAITLIEGTPTDNLYYYCPVCGARMEESE